MGVRSGTLLLTVSLMPDPGVAKSGMPCATSYVLFFTRCCAPPSEFPSVFQGVWGREWFVPG